MSTITTSDGTELYYKDWGDGPVVVFSHGWPLSADMWDGQMFFLAQHGFRSVALIWRRSSPRENEFQLLAVTLRRIVRDLIPHLESADSVSHQDALGEACA